MRTLSTLTPKQVSVFLASMSCFLKNSWLVRWQLGRIVLTCLISCWCSRWNQWSTLLLPFAPLSFIKISSMLIWTEQKSISKLWTQRECTRRYCKKWGASCQLTTKKTTMKPSTLSEGPTAKEKKNWSAKWVRWDGFGNKITKFVYSSKTKTQTPINFGKSCR